ncbi:unnamed protein product [Caenorhabditis sp. 36 PRJEB53466]|nr:unnamed protein product [Caenorhabditis sp. 36 PRJEB53466]
MMRFISDFERIDKMRNMRFTLQFFLTVEIIMTALAYHSMNTFDIWLRPFNKLIYLPGFVVLALSLFPITLCSALNFARFRVIWRISHMIAIVGVYYKYGFIMMPPAFVFYYSLELGYMITGIKNRQMQWPGKWIAEITEKLQDVDEQTNKDRLPYPFSSVANEVVRDDCTFEDEYIDDLFEYHTAHEDVLFPVISPKARGIFIV